MPFGNLFCGPLYTSKQQSPHSVQLLNQSINGHCIIAHHLSFASFPVENLRCMLSHLEFIWVTNFFNNNND